MSVCLEMVDAAGEDVLLRRDEDYDQPRAGLPAALRDAGVRRADHREPGLDPGVAVVDDLAAVDGVRVVRQSSPS